MIKQIQRLAQAVLVAGLVVSAQEVSAQETNEPKPCRWYQFGNCDDKKEQLEGLPESAPREGVVVTVDVSKNVAYLFRDGELVEKSLAATGSDKVLKKGKKTWFFRTPRGKHKVLRKITDPVWRKPDWAFIEEGKKVPPPDSPKRMVKGKLGKYALDLGDGILLHGTDDVNSFGRKASHGCIRLPEEFLELVWKEAAVGTEVHIFESSPTQLAGADGRPKEGLNDLDFQ